MTPYHRLLALGLYSPNRSPARQPLPPAAALAEALVLYGIASQRRHDGSARTAESRTGGWRDAEGNPVAFASGVVPVFRDLVSSMAAEVEATASGHVAALKHDRDRELGEYVGPWARSYRDEIKRRFRENRDGSPIVKLSAALERARLKLSDGAHDNRYALRVAAALRGLPAMRLDADELARSWLRSLPPGVVAQPQLWLDYQAAGSPGGRGKWRLFELADGVLGKWRMRRVDGSPRKAYTVAS